MSSWLYWNRWQDMYRTWEQRAKHAGHAITLTYPQLKGLFDWFSRELQLHPEVDVQTIDVEHVLDYDLTIGDAKEALRAVMITTPSEKDYAQASKQVEADIEHEITEKYPGFLDQFQERIEQETRKTVRKDAEYYKRRIREFEDALEEVRQRSEKEAKARAEKVKPAKFKVAKTFTEGILTYKEGTIIESADVEWVIAKIKEEKLTSLEPPRAEVPLPPKPSPTSTWKEEVLPITPKNLTVKQVKDLWLELIAFAGFAYPRSVFYAEPKAYEQRFLEAVKDAKDYQEAQTKARKFLEKIIGETPKLVEKPSRQPQPIVEEPSTRQQPSPFPRQPIIERITEEEMPFVMGTQEWWMLKKQEGNIVPDFDAWLWTKHRKKFNDLRDQATVDKMIAAYKKDYNL